MMAEMTDSTNISKVCALIPRIELGLILSLGICLHAYLVVHGWNRK